VEEEGEGVEDQDSFKTAREKYISDCAKKGISSRPKSNSKTLGGKRRNFIPPVRKDEIRDDKDDKDDDIPPPPAKKSAPVKAAIPNRTQGSQGDSESSAIESVNGVPLTDDRLRNVEPRMIELICNEILDRSPSVTWDDIAGLESAKTAVEEVVSWPILRPDIFKADSLRNPPKGVLLFGPPGTGKTMIGKAIVSDSRATFFSISASSLTSKWIGDGEKMVRALFAVARCYQPAVIFIDEIDSLLSIRNETENEASRRMKTEFLVQIDGAATSNADRILLIGATNRPQELDEAVRRRLTKKLYIPLPDLPARVALIHKLMSKQANTLTDQQIEFIGQQTQGYSGSDLHALCVEAAFGPIRALRVKIRDVTADQVRPVSVEDFEGALIQVKASVGESEVQSYIEFNNRFGTKGW